MHIFHADLSTDLFLYSLIVGVGFGLGYTVTSTIVARLAGAITRKKTP
jgi:hypothetical protein